MTGATATMAFIAWKWQLKNAPISAAQNTLIILSLSMGKLTGWYFQLLNSVKTIIKTVC